MHYWLALKGESGKEVGDWMTGAAMGRLSVCCMSSGRSPARLASILALFGSVADEIVVAVEEPRAVATHAAVGHVADRVLSFPPCVPADRPIPWLFGLCTGKWILNIDDDEVPSPRLIEVLPEIVARPDITHGWVARRWLYPTTDTYLAEAPWSTEFQLRLVLADARFVQFSDVFHRPVVAHGPGLFVDAPLWHLDTAVNPVARRRAKADAYELARPGMKIGGRAHNHALYVPELTPDATVAAVPYEDQAVIDAAIAGDRAATRETRALFTYTPAVDLDRAWPGRPDADTLHRGRIAVAAMPVSMRAGVQETIDAYVTNESAMTWRWGEEARPEIRVGYRWSLDGEPIAEPTALRTTLPADLPPGTTQFVPVHVVPPTLAGTYSLQLEVLHEGVAAFASTAPVELRVRERELLAVVGPPDAVTQARARLAPSPEVEAVVVLGNDSDRPAYGDYPSVSGLRPSLLAGLEHSSRVSRSARLSWRSLSLVWKAWRYRRTGITHDARLAGLFGLLAHSRALLVAGRDWPEDAAHGRESWRLVTTILVARTIRLPVVVSSAAVPNGDGIRNALFRWLIVHSSSPIADGLPPQEPPAHPDQPVLVTEPAPEVIAGESRDPVAVRR